MLSCLIQIQFIQNQQYQFLDMKNTVAATGSQQQQRQTWKVLSEPMTKESLIEELKTILPPEEDSEDIYAQLSSVQSFKQWTKIFAKIFDHAKAKQLSSEFYTKFSTFKSGKKSILYQELSKKVDQDQNPQAIQNELTKCKNLEEAQHVLLQHMTSRKMKGLSPQFYNELKKHFKTEKLQLSGKQVFKEKLKKLIEDQDPQEIYKKLLKCGSEDQCQDFLQDYVVKKKAEAMSSQFVRLEPSNKRKLTRIDQFYSKLIKEGATAQQRNEIKGYVDCGKKKKVRDSVLKLMGQVKGKRLFDAYQAEFKEQKRTPHPKAKYVKDQQGLKFYQYPQEIISEHQKRHAKSSIVLGQTGSGKSTFLNALVNTMEYIQLEDDFRYQCVIEHNANNITSVTQDITSYFMRDTRTNKVYKFIDTMGFGDTGGIDKDDNHIQKIRNSFKTEVKELHCVIFILKSSANKLTTLQRYVFESVMDLFGKDIAKNIALVLTFADAGKPLVLEGIQHEEKGFGRYWNQLSQPKHISVNNCAMFTTPDPSDNMFSQFWKIGQAGMQNLLTKINKLQPNNLSLTKDMISKKENLSNRIKETQQALSQSLQFQQTIKQNIKSLVTHHQNMNKNKDFTLPSQKVEYYAVTTSDNVTRCNVCLNSTCHSDCVYGDGQDKQNCCAMDSSGNCTVCPLKCNWMSHTNSHQKRQSRTITVMQTNESLKTQYNMAKDEKNVAERTIIAKFEQLKKQVEKSGECAAEMMELTHELDKICMSNRRQQTAVEYLQYLIMQEKANPKGADLDKIQCMKDSIKQYKLVQNYLHGGLNEERDEKLKKLFDEQISQIIDTIGSQGAALKQRLNEIINETRKSFIKQTK